MIKFLVSVLVMAGAAAAVIIYLNNKHVPLIPKSPAERWVDSLPEEQAACVRERVGIQTLNDIQAGRVDTDIRTAVTNADCGVVWNDSETE